MAASRVQVASLTCSGGGLRRRRPRRGACQVVQMSALGLVQVEGAGDGVQDSGRGAL
jgi:hypothetical protein